MKTDFVNQTPTIPAMPTRSIKSGRTARLEARITDAQKDRFQRAAELQGRLLSDFVVASAQEAATRVIQEHETIRLAQRDRTAFVAAILEDRAPSKRLVKAAKTFLS